MSGLDLAFGFLMWIPLAVWILALVNWMILGEVDPLSGMIGICVAVGMGIMAFAPPVPGLTPYLCFITVLSAVIYPIARSNMSRRQLKSLDVEGIETGYALLGQRPTNPVAKLKIAQHLYNLGHHGHAIAIADGVMKVLPERVFLDEHRAVRLWKRTPPHASAYRPIACVECGHLNPPGTVHCEKCGEPYLLHMVQGRFMPSELGRQLVSVWIALVLLVAGIPLAVGQRAEIALPLIVLLLLLTIVVLFAGFRTAFRSLGGRRNQAG